MRITELCDSPAALGEGPLWDHRENALYWIDSLGPTLFRFDYHGARLRRWSLPGNAVGSLAVREQGGLILAMDRGIYGFTPGDDTLDCIAEPLADRHDMRLNDGKVDPFGCFVTGAMNLDYRSKQIGSMYRLSPSLEISEILPGFTCFNGPCFSADGDLLYLTGRDESAIEVFDYGCNRAPTNGRVFRADCNPDGATVDADGYLWSAQWDDGCLLRFDAEGEIDDRIEFPGQVVSSVMFGGPELDLIFVTTTSIEVHGVSPRAQRAGRVLVVSDSGYRGLPEPMFAG